MRRRRVIFVGLVVVLAASLAVGTGADTVEYGEVETLEIEPEGEYVFEDEEQSEIRIQVGGESGAADGLGVNRNAVTDLGPVFTIKNVLLLGYDDESTQNQVTVWIQDDSDAITFYDASSDGSGSIGSDSDGVTLSPDDSVSVGMRVDTTGTDVETTLTESITVVADVSDDIAFDIEYRIDGEPVEDSGNGDTPTFNVEPGEEINLSAFAVAENGEGVEKNLTEELSITSSSDSLEIDGSAITAAGDADGETVSAELSVGDGSQSQQVEFDISGAQNTFDSSGGSNAIEVADASNEDDGSDSGSDTDGDADSDTDSDTDGNSDSVGEPDGDTDGTTESDRTSAETDGTSASTDSLLPTELGGLTLSPPWFLLALAAASLLVVFAYRRRREDDEA